MKDIRSGCNRMSHRSAAWQRRHLQQVRGTEIKEAVSRIGHVLRSRIALGQGGRLKRFSISFRIDV